MGYLSKQFCLGDLLVDLLGEVLVGLKRGVRHLGRLKMGIMTMARMKGCGCGLDEVYCFVILGSSVAFRRCCVEGGSERMVGAWLLEVDYVVVSDGRQLSQWKLCLQLRRGGIVPRQARPKLRVM